jgi:hypothetical protein
VPETGLDYLIMVRDLTNALTEARGLPPGVGQVQAESAVMSLLRFACATEAPAEDKSQANGRDAKLEAILEKLVVGARTSSALLNLLRLPASSRCLECPLRGLGPLALRLWRGWQRA